MIKKTLKNLLLLLFLILPFSKSYGQTPSTPLEFNEMMTSIVADLAAKGGEYGKKLQLIDTTTRDFSQLASNRKDMISFIDRHIALLKTLKDVKGSAEYRNAMIDFLIFEKTMVQNVFLPIEKLTKSSTKADEQKAIQNLQEEAAKENKVLDKIRVTQKKYADKNNFTIEQSSEQ